MKEEQQKNPETVKAETARPRRRRKKPRNRPRRQELERLT